MTVQLNYSTSFFWWALRLGPWEYISVPSHSLVSWFLLDHCSSSFGERFVHHRWLQLFHFSALICRSLLVVVSRAFHHFCEIHTSPCISLPWAHMLASTIAREVGDIHAFRRRLKSSLYDTAFLLLWPKTNRKGEHGSVKCSARAKLHGQLAYCNGTNLLIPLLNTLCEWGCSAVLEN